MNSDLRTAASQLAKKILTLDGIEKDAKAKKDKLKSELNVICDSCVEEFKDNLLEFPEVEAAIKISLNPPSVIDTRNDRALTPEQRQEIAMTLDDRYCKVDFNVKEIIASLDSDSDLKNVLEENHVTIRQASRYDVKKMK